MNQDTLKISIDLINDKVQFNGKSVTNQDRPIRFDYLPPHGDGDGYRGLELLMMSFGGCYSTAVVAILRKMHKSITDFRLDLSGVVSEQPLR